MATELGISPEGIDNLAAQANPTKPTSPSQWSGETVLGNMTVSMRFIPIPRFNEVKATVDIAVDWKRPFRAADLVTKPLPPPPGYEDVGFGTPPPPKGPQNPNPGPEYYEALIKAQKGERPKPGIAPTTTPPVAQPSASPASTPEVAAEKSSPASGFPIVVFAIIAAAVVAVIVFLMRRKSL